MSKHEYSEDYLESTGIDSDTQNFLLNHGLEDYEQLNLEFFDNFSIKNIEFLELLGSKRKISFSGIVIGTDTGGEILVSLETGEVFLVLDSDTGRLINNKISKFVKCIEHFQEYSHQVGEDDALAISSLKENLESTDRTIFELEETWWVVVFEQVEDGLL